MTRTKEMNLCEGPILKKVVLYALPLIASNLLQFLFNFADIAILGLFVGDDAVAAVGATASLINLIVNLFIGVSIGANITLARLVGQKDEENARKAVGTAIFISLTFGLILVAIGTIFAPTFLVWMDCDPDVLGMATTYLRIYFIGMPIMMLYNFSASILRAVGNTSRPFAYLSIGGASNVCLNVLFIIAFGMHVDGVAIATVISQGISATLAFCCLLRSTGYSRFEWKYFRPYKTPLVQMLKIGVPAGLQASMFSIANVFLQSSVNGLGKTAMTANTVGAQVDQVVFLCTAAIGQTAAAFVGQNYGAKNIGRIKQSVRACLLVSVGLCVGLGAIICIFPETLCKILSRDADVIRLAKQKLLLTASVQFFYGALDVLGNAVRGLGKSTISMLVNLFGICIFRLIWLATVFRRFPTFFVLSAAYPTSFIVSVILISLCYFPIVKATARKLQAENDATKEGDIA